MALAETRRYKGITRSKARSESLGAKTFDEKRFSRAPLRQAIK
jgi:hypothetical protein